MVLSIGQLGMPVSDKPKITTPASVVASTGKLIPLSSVYTPPKNLAVTADTAEKLQTSYGATPKTIQQTRTVAANPVGSAVSALAPKGSQQSATTTSKTGTVNAAPIAAKPIGQAAKPSSSSSNLDAEDTEYYKSMLESDYLAWQAQRAEELRRLQNYETQLFGEGGQVMRQEDQDSLARRRLAAQRAMAGMLQGGAYAGAERGLGTLQRADQDYAMQEMIRPFQEQTAADRLAEFGLSFSPDDLANRGGVFNLQDPNKFDWTTATYAGRQAAQQARAAAMAMLMQGLVTI